VFNSISILLIILYIIDNIHSGGTILLFIQFLMIVFALIIFILLILMVDEFQHVFQSLLANKQISVTFKFAPIFAKTPLEAPEVPAAKRKTKECNETAVLIERYEVYHDQDEPRTALQDQRGLKGPKVNFLHLPLCTHVNPGGISLRTDGWVILHAYKDAATDVFGELEV